MQAIIGADERQENTSRHGSPLSDTPFVPRVDRCRRPMKASVRVSGDVSIIDLEGRLVAGDQALRAAIDDLIADGKRKILVNLVGVPAIDSSGVGDLVGSKKLVEKAGAQLKLLIAQGRVRHVLDAMLLLPIFESFDDEAAAVASFSS